MNNEQASLFDQTKSDIELRFKQFHADNPHIYKLIKRFTFELIDHGHKNGGISMVVERVRWETSITTHDPPEGFKLSNDYRAHYARMLMRDYPQYRGFFRTRCIEGESETERLLKYST